MTTHLPRPRLCAPCGLVVSCFLIPFVSVFGFQSVHASLSFLELSMCVPLRTSFSLFHSRPWSPPPSFVSCFWIPSSFPASWLPDPWTNLLYISCDFPSWFSWLPYGFSIGFPFDPRSTPKCSYNLRERILPIKCLIFLPLSIYYIHGWDTCKDTSMLKTIEVLICLANFWVRTTLSFTMGSLFIYIFLLDFMLWED